MEIPDVVPGTTIASAWGNDIRDRTAQRYANRTDRDTLNPTPSEGDLAYLEDADRLEVFDGTGWVGVVPGGLVQRLVFTTVGDTAFVPGDYPWLRIVRALVVGGGGGGGGAEATAASQASVGSGGSGGGGAEVVVPVASLPASVTVTVGAGGGVVSGGEGNTGGVSKFGAFASASGGAGGNVRPASSVAFGELPGATGVGTVGDILYEGGPGGIAWADNQLGFSGHGGASALHIASGGNPRRTTSGSQSLAGISGNSGGGGGGGAANSAGSAAQPGGTGGKGIVLLDLYA